MFMFDKNMTLGFKITVAVLLIVHVSYGKLDFKLSARVNDSLDSEFKIPYDNVFNINLGNSGGLSKEIEPPSPIPDVSPLCQDILQDLSVKASNFTYCATANARPITMCRNCFVSYYEFYKIYDNISLNNDNDCENELLNRDKVMIVQSVYQYVIKLWSKAQCENCYVHINNETRISNDTLDYFKKLNNVNNCIENNKSVNGITSEDVKNVCKTCRELYMALNEKYDSLNTKFNNHVCMDIVDHMNITHHLWSNRYHCVQPHFESYPVLILSGIVCLIPIVFYITNRLGANVRESEIILQKRMSFVHSSHNSLQRL